MFLSFVFILEQFKLIFFSVNTLELIGSPSTSHRPVVRQPSEALSMSPGMSRKQSTSRYENTDQPAVPMPGTHLQHVKVSEVGGSKLYLINKFTILSAER